MGYEPPKRLPPRRISSHTEQSLCWDQRPPHLIDRTARTAEFAQPLRLGPRNFQWALATGSGEVPERESRIRGSISARRGMSCGWPLCGALPLPGSPGSGQKRRPGGGGAHRGQAAKPRDAGAMWAWFLFLFFPYILRRSLGI